MSQNTGIEWTDATWNPTRGCRRVSPGCKNCYAERQAIRQRNSGYKGLVTITNGHPAWTGVIRLAPESTLHAPLHWRKPQRIFVNSMSDLFYEELPDEAIDRVFAVMALCPQHTFQILTKRPERMLEYFKDIPYRQEVIGIFAELWSGLSRHYDGPGSTPGYGVTWKLPLKNVWLGVSCEDQKTADERIPLLLQTPAAVRFASYEPALGPVDFSPYLMEYGCDPSVPGSISRTWYGLDWVIVGGESGPGARPFDLQWPESVIEQCRAAGVACFVKQLGAKPCDGPDNPWRLKDKKGGDWSEWPNELRVREFPAQSRIDGPVQ